MKPLCQLLTTMAVATVSALPMTSMAAAPPWLELPGRAVYGAAVEGANLYLAHMAIGNSDVCRVSKYDAISGVKLGESANKDHNARGICYAAGSLFVVDARFDRVRRLDPSDFHEMSSFATPGSEPSGITFDGTDLWLTDPWYQHVYQLDLSGNLLAQFAIPDSCRGGLEWANGGLWTPVCSGNMAHYTPTGAVDDTRSFPQLPAEAVLHDVAIAGQTWFLAAGDRGVYLADPGNPFYARAGREFIGIAGREGELFVANIPTGDSDHGWITVLNAFTGEVIRESPQFAHNARGITYGDGSLWVVDALYDVIRRYDPDDFLQIAAFPTPGSEPCGISFDGTHLWLSDPWFQKLYQVTTAGQVVAECSIPNDDRMGLEWARGGNWIPVDSTTFVHQLPNCTTDSTVVLPVPPGSYVYDVTLTYGDWFAAARTRVYRVTLGNWAYALPGRRMMGIDADRGTLWLTHEDENNNDSSRILALDALTLTPLRESGDFDWNARGICAGDGSLWVSDAWHDQVHQVDPNDFHVISSFSTPGSEPCGIEYDGEHLWLTDPYAQHVYQLTKTGSVVSSFSIPDWLRHGLDWQRGGLWMPTDSAVVTHYLPDGTADQVQPVGMPPGTRVLDLAFTNGGLYATDAYVLHVFPPQTTPVAGVDDPGARGGGSLALRLAGPSPTPRGTSISYVLPAAAEVQLEILDVMGRVRSVLHSGFELAGPHVVSWSGLDQDGRAMPSGVYFARLQAGNLSASRKLVVAR